jgi:hypothetical protein
MKLLRVGAIVSIAWFAAAALTPLTSVAIRNSSIDSTTLGATTASTVRATTITATGQPANPTPTNSSVMGWNGTNGGGETDFINDFGAGTGGFDWYATGNSTGHGWTPTAPIMSLSTLGYADASIFNGGTILARGQYGSATGFVNGAWLSWDQSLASGEMDFIAQHVSGAAGGFNWYDTSSSTTPGSAIARMDGHGNLAVATVNATTFAGALSGNASTASAFNHTPSACAAGTVVSGISSTGAPTCVNGVQSASGPGGVTGGSSFSSTTSTVSFSPGFGDNAYQASCTLVAPSDPRAVINGITIKNPTSLQVEVATMGSLAISYAAVDCILHHN